MKCFGSRSQQALLWCRSFTPDDRLGRELFSCWCVESTATFIVAHGRILITHQSKCSEKCHHEVPMLFPLSSPNREALLQGCFYIKKNVISAYASPMPAHTVQPIQQDCMGRTVRKLWMSVILSITLQTRVHLCTSSLILWPFFPS